MWDVERLRLARARVTELSEFEERRRRRMQEREARARLTRPTGNVVPLGARVYRLPDRDDAA